MTAPAPETREREKDKLYVTDAELVRLMGVPERVGRVALREWSVRQPTFPKPDELMGGRRYWPAVKEWLDARNKLRMDASTRSEEPRRERRVR